jgi:hypothetical protein
MPTVAYEVIVSQSANQSKNNAVANAAKYLSYADQTDTVGYHGDVFDVNVYGRGEFDWGVGICVAFPVASPQDKAEFESEMELIAKVESFEEVHYEKTDRSEVSQL